MELCVYHIQEDVCLASFLAGRDANRGACTHPCRWKYAVVEENRPGRISCLYMRMREELISLTLKIYV